MSFFQWKDSMSVEIDEIDKQHMQLVSLIDNLYNAMAQGKGQEELDTIFGELFDYAKTHFFTEEKYMFVHQYPGYEEHKKEHEKFIEEVKSYKKTFDEGDYKASVKVANFLKDWLTNHIMKTDQQYGPYLRERING
ncbi:MAG: bacteriohemerythrin [Bacteroidota bacterium]